MQRFPPTSPPPSYTSKMGATKSRPKFVSANHNRAMVDMATAAEGLKARALRSGTPEDIQRAIYRAVSMLRECIFHRRIPTNAQLSLIGEFDFCLEMWLRNRILDRHRPPTPPTAATAPTAPTGTSSAPVSRAPSQTELHTADTQTAEAVGIRYHELRQRVHQMEAEIREYTRVPESQQDEEWPEDVTPAAVGAGAQDGAVGGTATGNENFTQCSSQGYNRDNI